MPLPDIPQTDYAAFEADRFGEDIDARIDGLGFEHAADSRIADLSRIGAWATAPPSSSEPVVQPAAAVPAPVVPSTPVPVPSTLSATPASVPAEAQTALLGPDVVRPGLEIVSGPVSDTSSVVDLRPSPAAIPVAPRAAPVVPTILPPGGGPAGGPLQDYARQVALRAGVDPDVFVRQIQQESGFNPNARSPAGAQGIAQIVPRFHPGVDVTDPYQSLDYAARLMRSNLDKYRGDYARALAAYNAGGGAVDRYGGVPPFEETQRYVDTILGGAQPRGPAPMPSEGVTRAGAGLGAATRDISQFGDPQLTNDEAYAACGPAAAVRFAQRYGRNPTLSEAVQLARTVGWTSSQGMAGLASEKALMDKLGVPTRMVSGADWGTFANEARTGNPVTISTRGHYFTADGWDPQSNRFHVGRSGLDLRGGKEWMTPEEMTAIMGEVQGGLLADNPQVGSPSMADQSSSPTDFLDRAKQAIGDSLGGVAQRGLEIVTGRAVDRETQQLDQAIDVSVQPRLGDVRAAVGGEELDQAIASVRAQESGSASPVDKLKSAFGDFLDSLSGTANQGAAATGAVPAPGGGYDPSAFRAETTPPQEGMPLRQDVRDIAQEPQPTLGDALETARQTSRAALVSPEGQLQFPSDEAMEPIVGALSRGVPGLNLLPPETVLEAGKALAPYARGPSLISDQEYLTQMDPATLEQDRQSLHAQFPDLTAEEIDRQIAERERTRAVAIAAGTHTGPGGAPRNIPGKIPEIPPGLRTELPKAERVSGAKPITLTPEEEVARLRLEQFPEEVRSTIEDAARARDWAREQRRGVIPDATAEQMADDLNRTFDEWMRAGKSGKAYNAEELRAMRNATFAQADKVRQIGQDVAAARATGNLTDNMLVQQFAEGQKLQALTELASGAQAEWGRAGRAFQDSARLVDLPPDEAIARIYKMVGGRENALKVVDEYNQLLEDGADIFATARFWQQVKEPPPGIEDWFRTVRYNSMLSGPRTLEVNVIGNGLEVPWRLARDTLASTLRGNPRELEPEFAGVYTGFTKGWSKFMDVLSNGITREMAEKGELPRDLSGRLRNPVARGTALALEYPGRVMRGLDEWANSIAYHMALGRRAGVMASREGLKGQAWDARVAEIIDNPSRGLRNEAMEIADRMVYRGDMGALGKALAGVQRVPYLGNILLPFLQTVYHITSRGIDRSPLGLAGTAFDVARGAYGPRTLENLRGQLGAVAGEGGRMPLGERLGDNLIGSGIFVGFLMYAQQGNVSGAGPKDPEKRDMLRAEGWQPYSIRVGDKWISYANWGPVAVSLSQAAAVAEAQHYREPGADDATMIADGMRRTAELLTEQQYLQGVGTVYKTLTNSERYGPQFAGQFVQALIPYGSALNTIGQAFDPYARQPEREDLGTYLWQSIEARLPGLRENVPVSLDQLGRPVPSTVSGTGALNPLRVSQEQRNAALDELLKRGADVGEPPKSVSDIPFTPGEQREVARTAGPYIEEYVAILMANPDYTGLAEQDKKRALAGAVASARQRAAAELFQRMGEAEIIRRRQAEQEKKIPVPIGL